jgi:hypothetical protein
VGERELKNVASKIKIYEVKYQNPSNPI